MRALAVLAFVAGLTAGEGTLEVAFPQRTRLRTRAEGSVVQVDVR
jgi:hypothetical protein